MRGRCGALIAAAGEKSGQLIRVANLLCPGNTVISGTKAAIEAAEAIASEKGYRTVRLAVAGAFHTSLMKPADEQLAQALAQVTLKPPRLPVWSNVDARPHTDAAEIRSLLVRQVLNPVLWEKTMRNLLAEGVTTFYEIGPGRVLAGLEQVVAFKQHRRAVHARIADLGIGRALRHHDRRRNAEPRRVVGDRLCVVAGAHRDHAAAALRGREGKELVQRAALLERGGELQVLELEEDLGAGELGERPAVDEGGVLEGAGHAGRCGPDVLERDCHLVREGDRHGVKFTT